jgi:hypothetical protein
MGGGVATRCGNGHDLDDGFDPPSGHRTPCPHCDSTVRAYEDAGTLTVRIRVWGREKHIRPGHKKPIGEGVSGMPDLHRKTGRLSLVDRSIDRLRDWYHERIVDAETGEVIREVDEPLSEHRGRGDARPDRRRPPGAA